MKSKRHPNFKGGRVITAHGYIVVYVGKAHHLADIRGYAYEHRLKMEVKLKRRLLKGEVVHHKDENKSNNRITNLVLKASNGIHLQEHLNKREIKRNLNEPNPTVSCKCGCGKRFKQFDAQNRNRQYVSGHQRAGKGRRHIKIMVTCLCGCGGKFNKFDGYGRERKFLPSHNSTWKH